MHVFCFCKQKTAYEMLSILVGSKSCIRNRFNIQVHLIIRSPEKNSSICPPEKNSLSHRQMSIRKSLHKKKEEKNGKQLPQRRVLTHAPRKAFHYPERDKNRPMMAPQFFLDLDTRIKNDTVPAYRFTPLDLRFTPFTFVL